MGVHRTTARTNTYTNGSDCGSAGKLLKKQKQVPVLHIDSRQMTN